MDEKTAIKFGVGYHQYDVLGNTRRQYFIHVEVDGKSRGLETVDYHFKPRKLFKLTTLISRVFADHAPEGGELQISPFQEDCQEEDNYRVPISEFETKKVIRLLQQRRESGEERYDLVI
jgi:hypothetical protein